MLKYKNEGFYQFNLLILSFNRLRKVSLRPCTSSPAKGGMSKEAQTEGRNRTVGNLMLKFICDDNLGKLAKWLRTLGYDTLFHLTIEDGELVSLALKENRIILSRDTKLSRFKIKDKYLLIQSEKPLEQLKEVIDHFNLKIKEDLLFSRCLLCNQPLEGVEKENIKERLFPYVYQTQENFVYCSICDRIYWSGTHVERMIKKLSEGGII
jgi:uncharacterized protein with PIN domain